MTAVDRSYSSSRITQPWMWAAPIISLAVLGWFLWVQGPKWGLPLAPHAPDWSVLKDQPTILKLHLGAAVIAFVLGLIQLSGVKGTTVHRVLGWSWALAMFAVAISSLFIRNINHGAFSWIHLFSGWTLLILPLALYAARRHDVKTHGRRMMGLFLGALLIAGMFTFFPGRLLWHVFLG